MVTIELALEGGEEVSYAEIWEVHSWWSVKALKEEPAWYVHGMARTSVWLGLRECWR